MKVLYRKQDLSLSDTLTICFSSLEKNYSQQEYRSFRIQKDNIFTTR